jgi:hypothetical protein
MADKRQKRVAEFIEPFRIKPGSRVTLPRDSDAAYKSGIKKKGQGVARGAPAPGPARSPSGSSKASRRA